MSWLSGAVLKRKILHNASHDTLQAFHGVFSMDKLPFAVPHYPFFMIVNTQAHNLPGEHWIVIFINRNKYGEVFDSLALPLAQPLIRWMNQFTHSFTKSHLTYQHVFSSTCGAFALFYILHRLQDRDCMTKYFSSSVIVNDKRILLYYQSLK